MARSMFSPPFKNEGSVNPGPSFRDRLQRSGNPLLIKKAGRGVVGVGFKGHISPPLSNRQPVAIPPFPNEVVRGVIARDVAAEATSTMLTEGSGPITSAVLRDAARYTIDSTLAFQQSGELPKENTGGEA